MRILLVDDHDLFREGLKYLLPVLDDTVQYEEAGNLEDALAFGGSDQPIDLILLEYYLPGVSGHEALSQCRERFESASVVVLSGEDDVRIIRDLVEHGAAGFIPKSSSREKLISALKKILAGGTYLPDRALKAVPSGSRQSSWQGPERRGDKRLPQRQFEVLMKAVQGKSNKVIARELDISDHTVKAHLSVAFRTLGVQNRTEAVYAAAKLGIQPGHITQDSDTVLSL